jgi:hypothetical protein
MVKDLFNFDGGSAYRLESGRILVAFTSPYDTRLWNQKYSMRAYEVRGTSVFPQSSLEAPLLPALVAIEASRLEATGADEEIIWEGGGGSSARVALVVVSALTTKTEERETKTTTMMIDGTRTRSRVAAARTFPRVASFSPRVDPRPPLAPRTPL